MPYNGPSHSKRKGKMSKIKTLLIASMILMGALSAEAREIAVIINARLPIDSLSLEEVKGIYLGEIRFIRGNRLKPIDQHESQKIRQDFLKHVLEMSKASYLRHWLHLIFQDSIDAPILHENSAAVIESVRESEEVIGYVWASEAVREERIKVVFTVQRMFTEAS